MQHKITYDYPHITTSPHPEFFNPKILIPSPYGEGRRKLQLSECRWGEVGKVENADKNSLGSCAIVNKITYEPQIKLCIGH